MATIKRTAKEINADINKMYDKMDKITETLNSSLLTDAERKILLSDYYEAKGARDAMKWVLGEMV